MHYQRNDQNVTFLFNFQKYNNNAITTGSLRAYWKIQAPWEEMPITLGLRPRVTGISSLGAWIFQCALSDPVVISHYCCMFKNLLYNRP